MEDVLLNKKDEKVILLGNEAIVRGALEEGVEFVATYPGTPASEVGNLFFDLSQRKQYQGYFEFSTNEKVALEAGIGASFSGLKTLVAMKNFGLNVALDSLIPFAYTGTVGPTLIIVADDPSCHSSAQSEENSRFVSLAAHLPILEPAHPQEAKDFVRLAFQLSQEFKIPVIVRTTTRVAHQQAVVRLASLGEETGRKGFVSNKERFVTMPPRVLGMKGELLEKIEKIKKLAEESSFNLLEKGKGDLGIITSGISYLYLKEAFEKLNLNLPLLKLAFFYPLPEEKIKSFIKPLKRVFVVEELEPYLEKEVIRLAKEVNPKLEVIGKKLLPEVGELTPEKVILALTQLVGQTFDQFTEIEKRQSTLPAVKHLSRFCPGCPYWSVFAAVKKIAPEGTIFGGDIGCYMLGSLPPHDLYDYLLDMSSSLGIGHGIAKANPGKKVIAFIGDSTFFHSGLSALVNAVFNQSNLLVIILDNGTTAMTGHQPHPGSSSKVNSHYQFDWAEERSIRIEKIVSASGVKHLRVVNSFDLKEVEKALEELIPQKGVSVMIARGMCALLAKSLKK